MNLRVYNGPFVKLKLTQGRWTILDSADWPLVQGYQWFAVCIKGGWYAATNIRTPLGRRTLRLHCLIMGEKGIDHIDGDGLNNRRLNLRLATQSQNCKNRGKNRAGASSPYKGVYWHKWNSKWMVRIVSDGKWIFLGYFDDLIEAAKAYDVAAKQHHGAFARLNFGT